MKLENTPEEIRGTLEKLRAFSGKIGVPDTGEGQPEIIEEKETGIQESDPLLTFEDEIREEFLQKTFERNETPVEEIVWTDEHEKKHQENRARLAWIKEVESLSLLGKDRLGKKLETLIKELEDMAK